MEDRTKNLTLRQTLVLSWDAGTKQYKESVEDLDADTDAATPAPASFDHLHPPEFRIPITKAWNAQAGRWTVTADHHLVDRRQNRLTVKDWAAGLAWPCAPAPRKTVWDRIAQWFIVSPFLVLLFAAAAKYWFDQELAIKVCMTGSIICMVLLVATKAMVQRHSVISGCIVLRLDGQGVVWMSWWKSLLTWSLWCFVAFGLAAVVLMFVWPNVIYLDGPELPRVFLRVFWAGMAVGGIGVIVSLVLKLVQFTSQLPQLLRQTVWSFLTSRSSLNKPESPAAPSQAPCRTAAVVSATVKTLCCVIAWAFMGVTFLYLGHHSWSQLMRPEEASWRKCFEIAFLLLPATMIALWVTIPILVCREVWRYYREGVQKRVAEAQSGY